MSTEPTEHTFVMTGATGGIGKEAMRRIVASEQGCNLVLLARTPSRLSQLVDEVGDHAHVQLIAVELDSMSATTAAARQVCELVDQGTIPPVTALVLNAGVQHVDAKHVSADGLEDTFAVNVVANHILVEGLAPAMSRDARVIITVSDTHFGDLRHNLGMVPGPRWNEPQLLATPGTMPKPDSVAAGRTAYSTSKLASIHQVHEYARRHPNLTVVGYNPGFVPATGLARNAGPVSRFAMARLLPLLTRTPIASSVESAGQDLAELATGRRTCRTGAYVNRDRMESSSPASYNPQRERELVTWLDDLVRSVN